MAVVKLKAREVVQLEELLQTATDARKLQRAQALLWLDEGESVEEVADRLRVTQQSVYNWITRFGRRAGQGVEGRVADGSRRGRPRTALGIIDPLLDPLIDMDPRELGYLATIWSAALLQHYLARVQQRKVSTKSISRALTRLRIGWKRPRHQLALRHPHWRQAKGGSRRDCGARSARSC
jgi:transposase